ncbi:MAG: complex I subunit 1/NuoH family protein [Myxococcaceae bacterium]
MKRLFFVLSSLGLVAGLLSGGLALAYRLNIALAQHVATPGQSALDALLRFAHDARLVNIAIFMLVFVMVIATLLTVAERKWSALMQDRIGPNRAKIAGFQFVGLFHIAADAVKMIFKEDFRPQAANRFLFQLGPILSFAPAFALFAVVPAGPAIYEAGVRVSLAVSEPDFGLLYVFAIASLAVFGTSLAGWASNNKFALLGGVRASSQMISYEVALGLSLVGLMMTFATVQISPIVDGQAPYLWHLANVQLGQWGALDVGIPAWGFILQPVGFVLFFAASFAETKRAPFDVPEGESEIIGYFVEYSGMKFGLFMISEFVEVVVLAAILTALFFGGWHLPFGEAWASRLPLFQDNPWIWGTFLGLVFWTKVILLCWLQLAIRWTFPRFRYDQIQTLGWKILLPAGLVNVFVTGALLLWGAGPRPFAMNVLTVEATPLRPLALAGLAEIALIVILTSWRGGEAAPSMVSGHDSHSDSHSHGAAHAGGTH